MFNQILLALLAMGQSAAFMWAFWNIWRSGSRYFNEPQIAVFFAELSLFVAIFTFGTYCILRLLKTRKSL